MSNVTTLPFAVEAHAVSKEGEPLLVVRHNEGCTHCFFDARRQKAGCTGGTAPSCEDYDGGTSHDTGVIFIAENNVAPFVAILVTRKLIGEQQ